MAGLTDRLRSAAPTPDVLKKDGIAGVVNAVVSVPDGLAAAAMVGVSPVYGLYASMTGRLAGGVLASSSLMQVVTTSAAALAAGQAIPLNTANRTEAVFLLCVLIGVFQIAFGLMRLGTLTRFVSHSVMTGFLTGVALLLILDQLALFAGYEPEGDNEISQTVDLFQNWSEFHIASLFIGGIALAIIIAMGRTKLGAIGPLVALIVPTLIVTILNIDDIQLVEDVGGIPRGFPPFGIPSLDPLTFNLVTSAMAIAAVVLVQGAGVGQSFPNKDGTPPDASRDFIAQGAGNVTSGLFSGIPVGGSVGQTALNVSTGAVSRWSSVIASIAMLAIVLVVPGLVEIVPMAALGALMVMAGLGAINVVEATSIWRTGWASRLPILVTFIATLLLSIPVAVLLGVMLSAILYLAAASDVAIVQIEENHDGSVRERPVDARLRPRTPTVIVVYGSLYFAGARVLASHLPSPAGVEHPVVVLRLRGRTRAGSTLITVLEKYTNEMQAAGGRLYLAGVSPEFKTNLINSGKLDLANSTFIMDAEETVYASTRAAVADAKAWLGTQA